MNGFLLHTDVISEPIKPHPDGNVLRWLAETDETILVLNSGIRPECDGAFETQRFGGTEVPHGLKAAVS